MDNTPALPPPIDPQQWLHLYLGGRHAELSQSFLTVFEHFKEYSYFSIDRAFQYSIDRLVHTFLFLFVQPDFLLPDEHAERYLLLNRTIANLVALSSTRTTDACLEILRAQPRNFLKILTLYSPRNSVKFDRRAFFDTGAEAAVCWYSAYAAAYYGGLVNQTVWENLREHFHFQHPALKITYNPHELFFGSTYVDGVCDRPVKEVVNRSAQETARRLPAVKNAPRRDHIAVVSACWAAAHSVYRNYYAYVKALKEKYRLTFFQVGRHYEAEASLFDEVRVIDLINGLPDMSGFQENDFQVIYYPEIGMTAQGIFLANRRLAPIQICSPGHSVSTFGAEIDYFISGADVEVPESPERNYSERLVLLPGMGVIHNRPNYEIRGLKKNTSDLVINCSWQCQKLNYPFVQTLKQLLDCVARPVRLRLFVGRSADRSNDFLPFYRDVTRQLGSGRVEVVRGLEYSDYMAAMEGGDLSLDSYHFGGCNTVSDTLFLRIPIITWEGSKWYNRIGSQMLRIVGIPECIATNQRQYLDIALKLIHDDEAREAVRRTVLQADLDNSLYSTQDAKYFLAAVDYLIANHERLRREPARQPIRVPRDAET